MMPSPIYKLSKVPWSMMFT